MTYAMDTNIISYLLKKNVHIQKYMTESMNNGFEFVMLPIVYYEILRWLIEKESPLVQIEFNLMCEEMPLITVTKSVWDKAAELYVFSRTIGKTINSDADLLIASICLVNDITLITNNTRHFKHIDGLKLISWRD